MEIPAEVRPMRSIFRTQSTRSQCFVFMVLPCSRDITKYVPNDIDDPGRTAKWRTGLITLEFGAEGGLGVVLDREGIVVLMGRGIEKAFCGYRRF